MANAPQDENTVDREGIITGTSGGPTGPVQQGRDVHDGSDKLVYGDPSKDTSKSAPDVQVNVNTQQPEQAQ